MTPLQTSPLVEERPAKAVGVWLIVAALLITVAVPFLWAFHRTEVIESHTTLQGGKRVDVHLSLQSTWRWQTPDRITGLRVVLDGIDRPVDRTAYYGLGPVDPQKKPLVLEIRGFPEIVIQGSKAGPFEEVRFRFQNYSFSERQLSVAKKSETKYYAMAPPAPAMSPIKERNVPGILTLDPESIKPVPVEHPKP